MRNRKQAVIWVSVKGVLIINDTVWFLDSVRQGQDVHRQFHAIAGARARPDAPNIRPKRRFADSQNHGDLFIPKPPNKQLDNLGLLWRQPHRLDDLLPMLALDR